MSAKHLQPLCECSNHNTASLNDGVQVDHTGELRQCFTDPPPVPLDLGIEGSKGSHLDFGIYEALTTPSDKWKYHHDRVSLLKDSAPAGYFTIFQEITGLIVDLITADLAHTIADISVGQHWGKYDR